MDLGGAPRGRAGAARFGSGESEIGARPASGRGIAIAALCFIPLYGFGRYLLHERAVAVLESRLYQGLAPVRAGAFPSGINPFRWRGLIETAPFYSIQEVNLLGEFDPAEGQILYKPEASPTELAAASAARRTKAFEVFLNFSQYPFWRFTPTDAPEGGIRVEAMDLRFGAPPHPVFVATAIVGPDGRVERSTFDYGARRSR